MICVYRKQNLWMRLRGLRLWIHPEEKISKKYVKKCALGKGEKYEKLREKYAEKNFAKLDDKRDDSCEVEGKSL